MTKILHVWDQAGVSCILAKYQRELLGHQAKVIKRSGFDPAGIMSYYNEVEYKVDSSVNSFLKYAKKIGKKIVVKAGYNPAQVLSRYNEVEYKVGLFNVNPFVQFAQKMVKDYDIIHVHDQFHILPHVKEKYPEKKVVIHYHGTRLRNTPQSVRDKYEKYADLILVSTPDLMEHIVDGYYLPNPIDIQLFSPRPIPQNGKALLLASRETTREKISALLEEHDISLDFDRIERADSWTFYKDMPELLSRYQTYIDLKIFVGGEKSQTYSTTALQSSSLGLDVLHYNYNMIRGGGLPPQYNPQNVVKQLEARYSEIK